MWTARNSKQRRSLKTRHALERKTVRIIYGSYKSRGRVAGYLATQYLSVRNVKKGTLSREIKRQLSFLVMLIHSF